MEECDCGNVVRDSPAPRRISRLGERTKGCVKRSFLFTYVERVRSLYTHPLHNALFSGRCFVCRRAHVKANASNSPIHPSPCGLLATSAF